MSETKNVPLCRDCKYASRVGLFRRVTRYSRCMHPVSASDPDALVVGGGSPEAYDFCSHMRRANCGREGHLFKGK